jgi:hypothetical protein
MVTTAQVSNDVTSFSHRDLYEECSAAYIDLGTAWMQPRYYFTHEELLDWWNSVYEWDDAMKAWVYTPEVQKAIER